MRDYCHVDPFSVSEENCKKPLYYYSLLVKDQGHCDRIEEEEKTQGLDHDRSSVANIFIIRDCRLAAVCKNF